MPLSIRLDEDLEKKISRIAKCNSMKKSDVIRRCLEKSLDEVALLKDESPYQIYLAQEKEIPGSKDGTLSIKHREKVLKLIQKKHS